MTTQLQSLQTLLRQAESERDEVLALLQQARARADAARAQADQLVQYRSQYQARWTTQFATAGAIEIVQCYQGFNDRLEQAVGQQQQAVQYAATNVERLTKLVQERELRVASVRKLIERRMFELRREEERRDQKASDEAAQRSGWNTQLPSRLTAQLG